MNPSSQPENHLDNDKDLNELFPCISCGVDADPADGFGNCTCGNEKLRDTIDQYTQSKLKAFAGEVEKAIGIPTQTFHTESGLSDATDTQINIAVDDMITWIKNGGSIDKKEREWFKSRTVEQVPKDLQAKGANLLRKEVLEALKAIKEKAGIE